MQPLKDYIHLIQDKKIVFSYDDSPTGHSFWLPCIRRTHYLLYPHSAAVQHSWHAFLEWVRSISDFLVTNIGFFFVPPGVAIMLYFKIIQAQFWSIVIASVVSTVLVLAVTGWVHQMYGKAGHTIHNKIGGKK